MSRRLYKIASLPKPTKILGLLARPNAPMVMANFLHFREQAKFSRFSGMTGKEAYNVYAESAMKKQSTMGSRIIWASEEVESIVGPDAPIFDAIGFLEYASPRSFLKYMLGGKFDGQARSAGLEGQWLLASTTIEGKSESSGGGIALIELFSGKDIIKKKSPEWLVNWHEIKGNHGGESVWVGNVDSQPIGYAAKRPSRIVVTQFPDVESLENLLSTAEANTLKELSVKGLDDYLAYQARPSRGWQAMLSD